MRAKYIKVNRNKQQSPKTQKKKQQQQQQQPQQQQQQQNLKKTPNRQTLQTCRNIKKHKTIDYN